MSFGAQAACCHKVLWFRPVVSSMETVGHFKGLVGVVRARVVVESRDEHWLREFLPGCHEAQLARWVKLELWLLMSQGIHAG